MKLKGLATITATAILLTACGNGSSDSGSKSEGSNKKSDNNQVIALDEIKTSPEDAVKKAQDVYSGQNLKGISYEKSNGEWAYKIEQQKSGEESEVIISDKNKKVLNEETEKEDAINKNDEFKYSDAIDYKKAIKKGQNEFDGDIKEWSLAEDEGKLVYDMDIQKGKTKHEITVDAKNGKVLNNEADN
ncbi:PepSY domain-containing protein [Staphylococcus edaphicus]|uniref:PepSY domain-containing protein n=1 Tax=Staphylococcus edaphicus TaxID=1955013 RepID=A0A2C6WKF9_9STAP|nr:PepSY domain-containing protein [Staphylococcus edaphicus]PHK48643.1 peptidase [Staphylococcus edaphicus]UQW80938.1 PepSY domain-containing protein [Staphylococcus edaphicus]